ncbi:plastocyanin/azurin family copper-binding protein [Kallotenue papyrolyticum]|uniref:plastocyanin/azurin family copper-binding protein n=1 Tax=Kallotenue papyrolyticum TaxID=1325125 RepID=UPI000492BAD3|nr:plastocyanin/azurin family copper-binding protein [Kallotenue papyrolyticum]
MIPLPHARHAGGRLIGLLWLALLVAGSLPGRAAQPQAGATVPIITTTDEQGHPRFLFQPDDLLVGIDTTVTWINQTIPPHTVTFENLAVDSGVITSGQSFSYTFTTPGEYRYTCSIHTDMRARVRVLPVPLLPRAWLPQVVR